MIKKRFDYIDYIKVFAILSVVFVHFRLNTEKFIEVRNMTSMMHLFYSIILNMFFIGVPLFIMVSGFLMANKSYSKTYFFNVFKIWLFYVIASLMTALIVYGISGEINVSTMIMGILKFNYIGYGWYVKMYLGLAFFMPLLNKVINISSKDEAGKYILAALLAIGVPDLLNVFLTYVLATPTVVLPNFFESLYPLVYYMIGVYLRNHMDVSSLSIKVKYTSLLVFMITTGIGIVLTYLFTQPHTHMVTGGYASIWIAIQSIALFLFIGAGTQNPKKSSWLIKIISMHTLGIYLMSNIVDKQVYGYIRPHYLDDPNGLLVWFPILPMFVLLIALMLSFIVDFLTSLVMKLITLIYHVVIKTSRN